MKELFATINSLDVLLNNGIESTIKKTKIDVKAQIQFGAKCPIKRETAPNVTHTYKIFLNFVDSELPESEFHRIEDEALTWDIIFYLDYSKHFDHYFRFISNYGMIGMVLDYDEFLNDHKYSNFLLELRK